MMTVSPEVMKKPGFNITKYLNDCDNWAKKTFGEQNIFLIAHHKDETTPHTSILLVPRKEREYHDGHKEWVFAAKSWLGGKKKLSELQTSFYEEVGAMHGLERGIEKSKSKHQDIKTYYGKVENAKKQVQELVEHLPEKKVLESAEKYKERLTAQILNCVAPLIQEAEKQEQNDKRIDDLERIVKDTRAIEKANTERLERENRALEARIDKEADRRANERYKGLSDADKAEILKPYKKDLAVWNAFLSNEKIVLKTPEGRDISLLYGAKSVIRAGEKLQDYETLTAYGLEELARKMKARHFETVGEAREFCTKKGIDDITKLPEKTRSQDLEMGYN